MSRALLRLASAVGLVGALGACAGEPAAPSTRAAPSVAAALPAAPEGVAVPPGMAFVPAGRVTVGARADEGGRPHERPAFAADVPAFLLDRSPVTVARFRAFVSATGHRTQAEAFGDGAVLDGRTGAWALVPGATWRAPQGPAGPAPRGDEPATQVSAADAEAFCRWDAGREGGGDGRLPTEVEWEHAARGAADRRAPYPWGDAPVHGEARSRANTWTGTFPGHDDGVDGFAGRPNPVGHFGATDLGLTDLAGNVWEWTASWYRPYPLGADGGAGAPPPGDALERVQRGGSFLCNPSYCHGFRVSARSHATPESSFAHVGFRCARSLPAPGA